MTGRWAPSPTGEFHLGNLRTGLLAWLFARSCDTKFLWRFEDLDGAVRSEFYDLQLRDFQSIGLDWDDSVVRQSERIALYQDAIEDLKQRSLTYRCWCTRREILEAAAAPPRAGGSSPWRIHERIVRGFSPEICASWSRLSGPCMSPRSTSRHRQCQVAIPDVLICEATPPTPAHCGVSRKSLMLNPLA